MRQTRENCERVELCRKLLASHASESDVERALVQKFGVGRRQARRYLAAARRAMLVAAERSREVHLAEAYAFYRSLAANADAKDADRIKAQERIEKLLGLDSASPAESPDVDGQPLNLAWLLTNLHRSAPPPNAPPGNATPA
jgi:hypothetical protein